MFLYVCDCVHVFVASLPVCLFECTSACACVYLFVCLCVCVCVSV